MTVDNPWVATTVTSTLGIRLDGLVGSGDRLPTARVVFDEGVSASEYVPLLANIAPHAIVMGELLDSFYVKDCHRRRLSRAGLLVRAAPGDLVDIWEVGNEVNGEWLENASGEGAVEKLAAATAVFAANTTTFATLCPGRTPHPNEKPFHIAMTFYYNGLYNNGVASSNNC